QPTKRWPWTPAFAGESMNDYGANFRSLLRSLCNPPLLGPQARGVLVAGRRDALEPLREDEGLGAEIERQVRRALGVDRLQAVPHLLALAAVELDLDAVDQIVELAVAIVGIVLPGPAVVGRRHHGRMQGRARHVLGRTQKGEECHARELALRDR